GRARRYRFADLRRVAGPYPHQAVLLDHGEGPQLRAGRDRQVELRRDANAVARAVVAEAVIGALEHAVGEHPTLGERHALVAAAVVERHDLAIASAPDQPRPAADLQPLRLVGGKLARAPGDGPRGLDEGIQEHRRLLLG